ncbi:MAG: helix-turn-helix domain-containing protein [Neisseria sp.]|uniref:winged helix-turn-helix transcriptional regulator n=1 Tax=Neisseria sp. TaxID=192066 RepID=UPI0026DCE933|nr:helix-turn-helix domain-containing protein [Neisseria sp.]MDO4641248.1 helix-turn-helix domain-containing protein [Neisseria sp.]
MKKISAIEMTMQLVGGKWKCLILYYLSRGTKRTRDLLHHLDGISQKVLSEQLRQLEADGLIEREAFAEVPPRVEYRLNEEGWTFIPVLRAMCNWGKEYDGRHEQRVTICNDQRSFLGDDV